MYLKCGYSRHSAASCWLAADGEYRFLTLDEIKSLGSGERVAFLANDGTVREITINGEVKRWKRDLDRVEISVKYGLYECGRFDAAEAMKRFVVRVGGK